MKVVDARINWMNGYGNSPCLELLVEQMPDHNKYVYWSRKVGQDTMYYAEQDGFVDFLCHNPEDQSGYGGRIFAIKVHTAEGIVLRQVKGPWSSRSSAMYECFGRRSEEVAMTSSKVDWDRGYTLQSGHIRAAEFIKVMANFFPDIRYSWGQVWEGSDEEGFTIHRPKMPEAPMGTLIQVTARTAFYGHSILTNRELSIEHPTVY